jgi:8-oxo-dGTP diphosphatase
MLAVLMFVLLCQVGESWDECAGREVYEETNLLLENSEFSAVVNSTNMDGDPSKHYVTIFMSARATDMFRLENKEPHKCEGWQWMTWTDLLSVYQFTPLMLFEPLINLIESSQDRPF